MTGSFGPSAVVAPEADLSLHPSANRRPDNTPTSQGPRFRMEHLGRRADLMTERIETDAPVRTLPLLVYGLKGPAVRGVVESPPAPEPDPEEQDRQKQVDDFIGHQQPAEDGKHHRAQHFRAWSRGP